MSTQGVGWESRLEWLHLRCMLPSVMKHFFNFAASARKHWKTEAIGGKPINATLARARKPCS